MGVSSAQSWDFDAGNAANRGWEGQGVLLAFDYPGLYDSTDPALLVKCGVCDKRVDSKKELRRRWDGVLVCKDDWDPRPRNQHRRKLRRERPRNLNAGGALTFLDDDEGRLPTALPEAVISVFEDGVFEEDVFI